MLRGWWCVLALWIATGSAWAQDELPPITDRNYAIDLYQGAVLGSARIVGMGGASLAVETGSAGILVNPAAVASWPETSTGTWDWDFHFDYLNRLPGADLDNNGVEDPEVELDVDPFVTAGLIGRWRIWSLGLVASSNTEAAPTDVAGEPDLEVSSEVLRLTAGAALYEETLSVGASIKLGSFDVGRDARQSLFSLFGTGIELGVRWAPSQQAWRVGASVSTPISGSRTVELGEAECDPNDCYGYILPNEVVAPWQLAAGGAWRFGETPWNQKMKVNWRDERSLIVAADVLITGPSDGGHGIGAFAARQLQRSGRHTSVSGRLGAEYEWLPGRLRVRGGTYWEPSRFEGVSGRLHLTLGFEVRVWSFGFLGSPRRLMLGLTGDAAEGYGNGGLSLGLWH